jgi:hypothetical protein
MPAQAAALAACVLGLPPPPSLPTCAGWLAVQRPVPPRRRASSSPALRACRPRCRPLLRRLYLGHVHRAKGRTVSLHHISKCGGTTMCQLAASNRCSNPHLNQEKNCVLNDK